MGGRTFVPGVEEQPGPGVAQLVGDPANALERIVISIVNAQGEEASPLTDKTFAAGDTIDARWWSLPGAYGIRVNGLDCAGTIRFESDRQTNVVLRLSSDTCSAETTSIEPIQ